MKINGLIDKPRWYGVKCCCSTVEGDVEHQHPIGECRHCKFQQCEDSMPREDFIIQESDVDEEGKETGTTHDKVISEITIVRGDKYQDIIGWSF
jgi:hypothetical protein